MLAANRARVAMQSSTVSPHERRPRAVAAGRRRASGARRSTGMKIVARRPDELRRERDTLGVVPGRGRDDRDARPRVGEPRDVVVGAADLERAGALQVLRLDEHRPAA